MQPPTQKVRHLDASAASQRAGRKGDSDRWSTTDQAAGMFLLALIYDAALGWLAFGLGGAGHGSGFFLAVCIPGLFLWPAAAVALAFAHRPIGRWVAPAILLVQYLLALDTMALTDRVDRADVAIMWGRQQGPVLAFVAIFLSGQAGLWCVYAVKRRQTTSGPARRRVTLAGALIAIAVVALLLAMVTIPARWVFLN